jgi:hypothetical protein
LYEIRWFSEHVCVPRGGCRIQKKWKVKGTESGPGPPQHAWLVSTKAGEEEGTAAGFLL